MQAAVSRWSLTASQIKKRVKMAPSSQKDVVLDFTGRLSDDPHRRKVLGAGARSRMILWMLREKGRMTRHQLHTVLPRDLLPSKSKTKSIIDTLVRQRRIQVLFFLLFFSLFFFPFFPQTNKQHALTSAPPPLFGRHSSLPVGLKERIHMHTNYAQRLQQRTSQSYMANMDAPENFPNSSTVTLSHTSLTLLKTTQSTHRHEWLVIKPSKQLEQQEML
jgi:hypothetical protein